MSADKAWLQPVGEEGTRKENEPSDVLRHPQLAFALRPGSEGDGRFHNAESVPHGYEDTLRLELKVPRTAFLHRQTCALTVIDPEVGGGLMG